MNLQSDSSVYLSRLKNRINLQKIPFTERGSRLLVFCSGKNFSIRLAERWFKLDKKLASYRDRPPIITQWFFTDDQGVPFDLQVTSAPHRLDFQTAAGAFSLAFADSETLLLTLPPGKYGLTFQVNVDTAQTDRRGGVLRLSGDIRRNIAYTTNAHLLVNTIEPHGPNVQKVTLQLEVDRQAVMLLNITPRLGFNRYLPDPGPVLEAAAQRWHAWFAAAPPVAEAFRDQYYFAWWIMRAGLISTRFYTTREAMTPSKIHYVGVWQWDAYFHALAYRYVDIRLAQDQLRILLDHQREDGMIPDAVHDEGTVTHLTFPVDADVTKPPLVAWAAWKLYEHSGDREFLDEIYEPVVRWNTWWFSQNDLDGNGLCEYQHPYSSGLDDSPLWDEGMPVESPDLNTYLCLQQEALARIARVIGEEREAVVWEQRAAAMAERLVRQAWDAQAGLFWARKLSGEPIRVRTPFNLFPLITGRMSPAIAARLVGRLTDERQFWPRFPVPTVALDDPKYDPNQMWRGPTWINTNYLLIEGLQRSGYPELARELRRRTLDLAGHDEIYEYYHPQNGEHPPKAAAIFGWSSAIFIDLAIQATAEAEKGVAP